MAKGFYSLSFVIRYMQSAYLQNTPIGLMLVDKVGVVHCIYSHYKFLILLQGIFLRNKPYCICNSPQGLYATECGKRGLPNKSKFLMTVSNFRLVKDIDLKSGKQEAPT